MWWWWAWWHDIVHPSHGTWYAWQDIWWVWHGIVHPSHGTWDGITWHGIWWIWWWWWCPWWHGIMQPMTHGMAWMWWWWAWWHGMANDGCDDDGPDGLAWHSASNHPIPSQPIHPSIHPYSFFVLWWVIDSLHPSPSFLHYISLSSYIHLCFAFSHQSREVCELLVFVCWVFSILRYHERLHFESNLDVSGVNSTLVPQSCQTMYQLKCAMYYICSLKKYTYI